MAFAQAYERVPGFGYGGGSKAKGRQTCLAVGEGPRIEGGVTVPLVQGYSKGAIAKNISEMVRAGHPRSQAIAAAYSTAKRAFKKKNPGKALPSHLK